MRRIMVPLTAKLLGYGWGEFNMAVFEFNGSVYDSDLGVTITQGISGGSRNILLRFRIG
jgi:hypothetical protein